MVLLSLCTLTATASVAAIRFPRSVHIHAVRILPSSGAPLPGLEDFISHTAPSSFPLELFFNWQAPQTKSDKPKATNVLVKTTLQYNGELCEYEVDASEQLTTRLLIVKGPFTSLTLAVYGREQGISALNEAVEIPLQLTYDPAPLPDCHLTSLPSSLDISNMINPLSVSRRILSLSSLPVDVIELIRHYFSFPPRERETEAPLDLLLVSYEIGENWLSELIDVLERPIYEDDLSNEVLNNLSERILESLGQSPSTDTVRRLFLLLTRHTGKLIDCVVSLLLSFINMPSIGTGIFASIAEASLSLRICERINMAGINMPLQLIGPVVASKNIDAWDTLRNGHLDLDWISHNLWAPGFLPSVLEIVGPLEGDAPKIVTLRICMAAAGVVSLFIWANGEGVVGQSARAVLDVWISDDVIREVIRQVVTQPIIAAHLTAKFGVTLLERLNSYYIPTPTLPSLADHVTKAALNGSHHLADARAVSSASLRDAVARVQAASLRWPEEHLHSLTASLWEVQNHLETYDTDAITILRSFWQYDTAAADCFCDLLFESCRQLRQFSWSLTESSITSKDLFRLNHMIIRILCRLIPEYGMCSALIPSLARVASFLLLCTRQSTYAACGFAEPVVLSECVRLMTALTSVNQAGQYRLEGADTILPALLLESLQWEDGVDPLSRAAAAGDLVVALLKTACEMTDVQRHPTARRIVGLLPSFHLLICALGPSKGSGLLRCLVDMDDGLGITEWLVLERVDQMRQDTLRLTKEKANVETAASTWASWGVQDCLESLEYLDDVNLRTCVGEGQPVALALSEALWAVWDYPIIACVTFAEQVVQYDTLDPQLKGVIAAILLRASSVKLTRTSVLDIIPSIVQLMDGLTSLVASHAHELLLAVGHVLTYLANNQVANAQWRKVEAAVDAACSLLQAVVDMASISADATEKIDMMTFSAASASKFTELAGLLLSTARVTSLQSLLTRLSLPRTASVGPQYPSESPLLASSLPDLIHLQQGSNPSTPLLHPFPGVFGFKTSPSSAPNTSPVASLAKTYSNNDFRELRTIPSARLNTSRPPSRHVDEFETITGESSGGAPPFGAFQVAPTSGAFATF